MAGGNSSETASSTEVFVIILVVALFALALFIQSNFDYIAEAWRWLRIAELTLFSWIPSWVPFYGGLDIPGRIEALKSVPHGEFSAQGMREFDNALAPYFTWLIGGLTIWLGVRRIARTEGNRRNYDMESLLKFNAPAYPFVEGPLKDHPEHMDIDLDRSDPKSVRYASALNPYDFATLVPPLGLEKAAERHAGFRRPILDLDEGEVDLDLCERAFAAQLDRPYEGLKTLRGYERKLYERFVSHLELDDQQMRALIRGYLAAALEAREPATAGRVAAERPAVSEAREPLAGHCEALIDRLLKGARRKLKREQGRSDYGRRLRDEVLSETNIKRIARDGKVKKIGRHILAEDTFARHGFVITGMMSLLDVARESGVIAPVEFAWLKGVDRTLWYALQSVGRKTPFVEGGGAFAHWEFERLLGRPLTRPEVQTAVEALVKALRDGGHIDQESP